MRSSTNAVAMRTTPSTQTHPRGVFERPKGSGVWWVCYFDQHGRRHREKVGPKALALKGAAQVRARQKKLPVSM